MDRLAENVGQEVRGGGGGGLKGVQESLALQVMGCKFCKDKQVVSWRQHGVIVLRFYHQPCRTTLTRDIPFLKWSFWFLRCKTPPPMFYPIYWENENGTYIPQY